MAHVELATAITSLREELMQAAYDGQGERLRFRPTEVELTVHAELRSGGVGKAGIRWFLLEAGAEVSRESLTVQTVTVKLQPLLLDESGRPMELLVSDEERQTDPVPQPAPQRELE